MPKPKPLPPLERLHELFRLDAETGRLVKLSDGSVR